MDDAIRYRLTTWRKRLERRGWVSLRRSRPPGNRLVEYHVVWQGRLISGRVRLSELDHDAGFWQPGSPVYLLERGQDVEEGVWRVAKDQAAAPGRVVRSMPI